MPTWNEIETELEQQILNGLPPNVACDQKRHGYLKDLAAYTGRPNIAYYSGFLQKRPDYRECSITDFDMNGFMAVLHNLDTRAGLDLILHTPGGGIEATRAIVSYLYSKFDHNIRVIVPQIAMSAGTMIACAAKSIVLARHSSLGPIDPQVRGFPATGVVKEIEKALEEISQDPARLVLWQEIFRKYQPAFIAGCEMAIEQSNAMVAEWLERNMLSDAPSPAEAARSIVASLTDFSSMSSHSHHLMRDKCRSIGLVIEDLEQHQPFQELVLSVHHSYVATFARNKSIKIIDNSNGSSWNVSEI
ncbi:SDH family Clp fold serine proteinase [Paracoccus sanguinis]|uniref:SDH family Clp fold serine proteinase n=1 Tax=Paracoccus sanguinis TaxID=1545044 RepID=UPI000AE79250|nr:ATP-dependent Clp protease proteolytic subunit [Paracoccus sanguinis]